MCAVASAWSSSFVCDTPSESNTSGSPGSASFARVIAAIARTSSSFSACTVPRRRQPSHDAGSARTAASSASAASDNTPRRNKSRPIANASARPRYGFGSTKRYWLRSAARRAAPSSATRSHTFSSAKSGFPARIASNSAAHSSGTEANSSAHRCAASAPEEDPGSAAAAAAGPTGRVWFANSEAHPFVPPLANSEAHPLVPSRARSLANSPAHASPVALASAPTRPVSASPSSSTTISPRDIRETKFKNWLFWNFGSGFARSVSASRADCDAVSAWAAVSPTSPAARSLVAPRSRANSEAHPSVPSRARSPANSPVHVSGVPEDCFTPLNSSAHGVAPALGGAEAVSTPKLVRPRRRRRRRGGGGGGVGASRAAAANSRAHPSLEFAAASGPVGTTTGGPRAPACVRGPSIAPSGAGSTPRSASAAASRAVVSASPASALRCRAMIALRFRITVFSVGDSAGKGGCAPGCAAGPIPRASATAERSAARTAGCAETRGEVPGAARTPRGRRVPVPPRRRFGFGAPLGTA